LLAFVRMYVVFLSPIFGGACKFYPSCSNYAFEAVSRHGAKRGSLLAIGRLLRCRPFTNGGFDPVPEVIYQQDALQQPKSPYTSGVELASQESAHRPTQPVVTETWSAAGTLGVERRL
jgi:putative membrane protein insertion efficiency factor